MKKVNPLPWGAGSTKVLPSKEDLQTNLGQYRNIAAWANRLGRFFVLLLFFQCNTEKDVAAENVYEGPIRFIVAENTLMTDSGRAVIRIQSSKRLDFKNGDQEWPEGVSLEMYNKAGKLKSTFTANHVTYSNEENLYKGTGNVIVKNYENKDELNTEELFWDPTEKKFFTEKFVTISSEDEVHTGQGLTADDNFESYTILQPTGTINLEDSP